MTNVRIDKVIKEEGFNPLKELIVTYVYDCTNLDTGKIFQFCSPKFKGNTGDVIKLQIR